MQSNDQIAPVGDNAVREIVAGVAAIGGAEGLVDLAADLAARLAKLRTGPRSMSRTSSFTTESRPKWRRGSAERRPIPAATVGCNRATIAVRPPRLLAELTERIATADQLAAVDLADLLFLD